MLKAAQPGRAVRYNASDLHSCSKHTLPQHGTLSGGASHLRAYKETHLTHTRSCKPSSVICHYSSDTGIWSKVAACNGWVVDTSSQAGVANRLSLAVSLTSTLPVIAGSTPKHLVVPTCSTTVAELEL
jgi:hypothetical protein